MLRDIDLRVPAGRLHRARRRVGRRQVDAREADRPLLRPRRGRDPRRRRRPARRRAAAYRRQLGVVLQDPFLFAGTIADNIRFARPDATDDEVRETAAARRRRPRRTPLRRRARPPRSRGRRRPLGGRATADLDRARAARGPAHPHPRRGDVEHRPSDRAADRAGARPPAPRPHVADHRPSPRDGSTRGRGARDRARPDRTARARAGAAWRRKVRSATSRTSSRRA